MAVLQRRRAGTRPDADIVHSSVVYFIDPHGRERTDRRSAMLAVTILPLAPDVPGLSSIRAAISARSEATRPTGPRLITALDSAKTTDGVWPAISVQSSTWLGQ